MAVPAFSRYDFKSGLRSPRMLPNVDWYLPTFRVNVTVTFSIVCFNLEDGTMMSLNVSNYLPFTLRNIPEGLISRLHCSESLRFQLHSTCQFNNFFMEWLPLRNDMRIYSFCFDRISLFKCVNKWGLKVKIFCANISYINHVIFYPCGEIQV